MTPEVSLIETGKFKEIVMHNVNNLKNIYTVRDPWYEKRII